MYSYTLRMGSANDALALGVRALLLFAARATRRTVYYYYSILSYVMFTGRRARTANGSLLVAAVAVAACVTTQHPRTFADLVARSSMYRSALPRLYVTFSPCCHTGAGAYVLPATPLTYLLSAVSYY